MDNTKDFSIKLGWNTVAEAIRRGWLNFFPRLFGMMLWRRNVLYKIVLFLVLITLQLGACQPATNIPKNTSTLPSPNLIVPSILKETVTFVFKPLPQDPEEKVIPNGTGFFVGVEDKLHPGRSYVYLVTAKHVIQEKGNYFPFIAVRLNKKSGGADVMKIPLIGEGARTVYVHKEPDVDLAVIPLAPQSDIYDYKYWGYSWSKVLTEKERIKQENITSGDEVFFIGLLWQLFIDPSMYLKKNIPIVKFGRVAAETEEKIPVKEEDDIVKLLDLHLIEAQAIGGNSGSPVFIHTRGGTTLLAGILTGHYIDRKENAGIAYVIPAYKLSEILFSDELKDMRGEGH